MNLSLSHDVHSQYTITYHGAIECALKGSKNLLDFLSALVSSAGVNNLNVQSNLPILKQM